MAPGVKKDIIIGDVYSAVRTVSTRLQQEYFLVLAVEHSEKIKFLWWAVDCSGSIVFCFNVYYGLTYIRKNFQFLFGL